MGTKRHDIIMLIAQESVEIGDLQITIGGLSQTILNANNVKYLTTPVPLNSNKWQLIDSVSFNETSIYLYKNLETTPRSFIPTDFQVATTISEFRKILENGTDISKTVVLEEEIDIPRTNSTKTNGEVQITHSENTQVKLNTKLDEKSLVVLSDSFYPGWEAYIDGQQTKIYPANINSRAIIAPAGNHQIEYVYKPPNIRFGTLISVFSLLLALVILWRPKIRTNNLKKGDQSLSG
jgi:uncharacterized membrane protein YfhO